MLDPPGLGPLAPSPTLHAPRLSSPAVRRRHMAGAKLGRAQRPGVKSETHMSFVSPPTAADNEVLCAQGPAQSGPCGRLRTVTPRGVFLPVPRACKLLTRHGEGDSAHGISFTVVSYGNGPEARAHGTGDFLLSPSHISTPGLRPSGWPGRTSPAPPGGRREGQSQQGELKEGRGA